MAKKVLINLQSGSLGAVATANDGVAGLVIGCDPGTTGIVAGTIFTLRSPDDAVTNKISEIPYAYQQVKEFYAEAGTGAKLYVLICANTETLEDMADAASTNKYAKTLVDYAEGEIDLLGICRQPAVGYTPTVTNGIDLDSEDAVVKMQLLAEDCYDRFIPVVGFVECRSYNGTAADLTDFTEDSKNYVAGIISATSDLYAIDPSAASIGLAMGRAASLPVQRKIARVKDGPLAITGSYLSDVKSEIADFDSVAEKGFIVIGSYANKAGAYFMQDSLLTATTDDYKTISLRRTINKMVRIVYATYINEINDDIELTSEGKLSPATVKYFKGIIENQVNTSMTGNGELSSFEAYVDPDQNILSTSKLVIRCAGVPKGYTEQIVINLGFSNPNA